jgi:hypothetical protein
MSLALDNNGNRDELRDDWVEECVDLDDDPETVKKYAAERHFPLWVTRRLATSKPIKIRAWRESDIIEWRKSTGVKV